MFTVGEFARLAQVSKRLLRYYDEIGLLKPDHTDSSSGYRFYTAGQLASLNRILALKDLGLSLEQIQRTLESDVSVDELQGMLMMKKAEIENQLLEEMRRIRKIETRLQIIRDEEANTEASVVVKNIPTYSVLGVRRVVETYEASLQIFGQMHRQLPRKLRNGFFYCVCHDDDFVETNLDLEMGVLLEKTHEGAITLSDGLILEESELPGAEMMATTIVHGTLENIFVGYAGIMRWAENNGYRLTGMSRERLLQLPENPYDNKIITEIQYPIEPIPVTGSRDSL